MKWSLIFRKQNNCQFFYLFVPLIYFFCFSYFHSILSSLHECYPIIPQCLPIILGKLVVWWQETLLKEATELFVGNLINWNWQLCRKIIIPLEHFLLPTWVLSHNPSVLSHNPWWYDSKLPCWSRPVSRCCQYPRLCINLWWLACRPGCSTLMHLWKRLKDINMVNWERLVLVLHQPNHHGV